MEKNKILFVWLVGFLTSSSTTRLYRGREKNKKKNNNNKEKKNKNKKNQEENMID